MERRAHASPTKDFFVTMLTRDISLEDCILDLLDNCIDGARRTARAAVPQQVAEATPAEAALAEAAAGPEASLAGFHADIRISSDLFEVEDNCGGISLDNAVDYAFHFGRRKDAPPDAFGIGLYGIGLKRALFKLGRHGRVTSTRGSDAFAVIVDIDKWLAQADDDWDFDLVDADPLPAAGARISVDSLHPDIVKELDDATFVSGLRRLVARDYAFILGRGFAVSLDGVPVEPYAFEVKDGSGFEPVRATYKINGVSVEVVAGLMADPPDDLEPSDGADRLAPYYGWYVACNDRIVVAGDKTDRTVWGRDEFPSWHPQYYGFIGIVRFTSDDPKSLPWTTTKRDVDEEAAIYRDAIAKMQATTRHFIAYTNARKQNLDAAKEAEATAVRRPIGDVTAKAEPSFPNLPQPPKDITTVQYKVTRKRLAAVAEALGNRSLTNREVGERTFEYYEQNEVG